MRALPWDRLTLLTKLSPDEVASRLRPMVGAAKFSLMPTPQAFRGTFDGTRFKLTRVLGRFLGVVEWNNAFKPVLLGELAAAPGGGTSIAVRMRPHLAVAVFMGLWLFGATTLGSLLFLAIVTGNVHSDGSPPAFVGALISLGLPLSGYLLVIISFRVEATRAQRILCEALEATA